MILPPAKSGVTPVSQEELSEARNSVDSASTDPRSCSTWLAHALDRGKVCDACRDPDRPTAVGADLIYHGVDLGLIPAVHRHLCAVRGEQPAVVAPIPPEPPVITMILRGQGRWGYSRS